MIFVKLGQLENHSGLTNFVRLPINKRKQPIERSENYSTAVNDTLAVFEKTVMTSLEQKLRDKNTTIVKHHHYMDQKW